MDDDGNPYPPPYKLVDNAYSLLDKTDFVFIDPISTGYSRPIGDTEAKEFHGLEEDIESVGQFIRSYTTSAKRWSSPKFLVGESYGTTRATGLVHHLQSRHGVYFNGVMLVSSILDFKQRVLIRVTIYPMSCSCLPSRRPPGVINAYQKI